jgi:urocanate hydratase
VTFTKVDEPDFFGADAADAWAFVSGMGIVRGLTETLDEATRAQTLAGLRRLIESHQSDEGVLFASASWLITGRRR